MRNHLFLVMVVAAFAGRAAFADFIPFIKVLEPTEGSATVERSSVNLNLQFLGNSGALTSFVARLPVLGGSALATGQRAVVMHEPPSVSSDQPISDMIVLDVGSVQEKGRYQPLRIDFYSNLVGRSTPPAGYSYRTVFEDGTLQDLTMLLNVDPSLLHIYALPGLDTAMAPLNSVAVNSVAVPLPSVAWLGLGLMACMGVLLKTRWLPRLS
jgi:hypothetical protein